MTSSIVSQRNFAELQFTALRSEILSIRERIIKLESIGITGIPLVLGVGDMYDITAVLMVGPVITLVFAFMLVFEQGSLMRAGEYIKNVLEPILTNDGNDFRGWESWLQDKPRRRRAESFIAWSVRLLFALYFVMGTYLAYGAVLNSFSQLIANCGLAMYCGVFSFAMYLVVIDFRIGTGKNSPARRSVGSTQLSNP